MAWSEIWCTGTDQEIALPTAHGTAQGGMSGPTASAFG